MASKPTASELYARNTLNLVKLLVDKQGGIPGDFADEVLVACLLPHRGEIRHAASAERLGAKQEAAR